MTIQGAEFASDNYVTEKAPNSAAVAEGYPDLVRIYLNQIGKVALLNAEEEVDLAKRIEAGLYAEHKLAHTAEEEEQPDPQLRRDLEQIKRDGERAKAHMLEANARLVVNLAKRARNEGLGLLDRVEEGNLGLIRAVEKFDYKQGFKFSTYATWWIRQAISRGQADRGSTIRIPVHVAEQITKISRVKEELYKTLNRDATDEELAAKTGLKVSMVRQILDYNRSSTTVSLETTVGSGDSSELGDLLVSREGADPVFTAIADTDRSNHIKAALASLSERDREIVCRRYGLYDGRPQTLSEIAKAYNMSRERIRQIERDALTKLRGSDQAGALKDFY